MLCLSYTSGHYHSNYTWRRVQVLKLSVMQPSPSSHFISHGPNTRLGILLSNALSLWSFVNVKYQHSHPYITADKIIVSHILNFKLLDSSGTLHEYVIKNTITHWQPESEKCWYFQNGIESSFWQELRRIVAFQHVTPYVFKNIWLLWPLHQLHTSSWRKWTRLLFVSSFVYSWQWVISENMNNTDIRGERRCLSSCCMYKGYVLPCYGAKFLRFFEQTTQRKFEIIHIAV
jgi:hypothetical protein